MSYKLQDYELHSKGSNWFHFRVKHKLNTVIESFSVTYCHDGTVCMTGDMGCLTWQREYFPKKPDYGFPFPGTGIGYFKEKIVRAEESQIIKSWSRERAIEDVLNAAREEDRNDEDRELLWEIYDQLPLIDDNVGYDGQLKMIDMFMDATHTIEGEEWCEFGVDYSDIFKMRFEMLKSVSNWIVESITSTDSVDYHGS